MKAFFSQINNKWITLKSMIGVFFKGHAPLTALLLIYFISLLLFGFFRIILFLNAYDRAADASVLTMLQSFVMGVRFDLVITGYILLLPALIWFVLDLFKLNMAWVNKVLFVFVFLLFAVSMFISAADIPYFNQFFQRFSIGAFEWMDHPRFVFAMIVQEPMYLVYLMPTVFALYVWYKVLKKLMLGSKVAQYRVGVKLPLYVLALGVMFLGIRGRIAQKSPIRVGTAYFSDNAFLNQLGLNPVFTLFRSYLDNQDPRNKRISWMDGQDAIQEVQHALGISSAPQGGALDRMQLYNANHDTLYKLFSMQQVVSSKRKPNVVLVLMESMSAAKMSYFGNQHQITPFLDSLVQHSLFFDSCYSAGKHTFNGIFSTLFSMPALLRQHPMRDMYRVDGVGSVFSNMGYSSIFFTTHDGQFDNVAGFLKHNYFNRIVSQSDYPSHEVKTTLGVTDDYMFRFAIPILNDLAAQEKPFVSVFMTASDHKPYYIPPYFKPKTDDITTQIVSYADWSLQQFLESAAEQPWFDETVFVFIADHGVAMGGVYDIALNYHHIPFLIFSPKLLPHPQVFSGMASQIDVLPSLMHVLKQDFLNTGFGINLFIEQRPYALLNDDDKVGVIDSEFLLIMRENEPSKLYKYKLADKTDYAALFPNKVADMEHYAKTHMQAAQALLH